jgi:hypothetical protein
MATSDQSNKPEHVPVSDTHGTRERTASNPGFALPGQDRDTGATAVSRHLARFMFDLQADDYGADDAMRELAWADDRIHDFWLGQAGAVVAFLGLERCA